MEQRDRPTLLVSKTVVFTALVSAATIVLSVYFPLTKGYFNLGETMVYLAALLLGPAAGAFAGGVGSMIADVALGYTVFAPGTLVIKAAEGYLAGLLARRAMKMGKTKATFLSSAVIVLYFAVVLMVGLTLMTGEIEFSIYQLATLKFWVSPFFWVILAMLGTLTPAYYALRRGERDSWLVLSLLAAGLVMVSGYFLYETLAVVIGVLPGIVPVAEVPLNVGQVVIGSAIAIPLYKAVTARRVLESRA